MADRLIIDRFEDGEAFLQDERKRIHRMAKSELPTGAREGDCLCMRDGRLEVDEKGTKDRRSRMNSLLEKLTIRK